MDPQGLQEIKRGREPAAGFMKYIGSVQHLRMQWQVMLSRGPLPAENFYMAGFMVHTGHSVTDDAIANATVYHPWLME